MEDRRGWHRAFAGLALLALLTSGLVRPAHTAAVRSSGARRTLAGAPSGASGVLVGWGDNSSGQNTPPPNLEGVSAVAAAHAHSLALMSDGTVIGWGNNTVGQISIPAGLSGVAAVAVGDTHSLALQSNGEVVAWGYNGQGQTTVPSGLSGVIAVAAGGGHSLALKSDGTVVAWGANGSGQSTVPAGLSGVTAVAAGAFHSLALRSDGTVVAWGLNDQGQSTVPAGLSGVTAVAACAFHSLALKNNGTVVAWGLNDQGQSTVPGDLTDVTAVEGGYFHSVALRSDGTVVAWGSNSSDQATVPAGLAGVTAVSAGGDHTLALTATSRASAWGNNQYGQAGVPAGLTGVTAVATGNDHNLVLQSDGTVIAFGLDNFGQSTVPADLSGVTAVAAGLDCSAALKSDGTVVAWGKNDVGQSAVPGGLSGVTAVAAGGFQTVALKNDGTVVVWGDNTYGQLVVPAEATDVIAVASGFYHILALKSDGTVIAWGFNENGEATVPVGLSGVTAVSAAGYVSMALKSDGTVVAWGQNNAGQTDVPADLTGVTGVAAGVYHALALKGDGSVVGWGFNDFGEATVPPGLSGITSVATGVIHSLVISPFNSEPQADADKLLTVDEDTVSSLAIGAPSDPGGDPLTIEVVTVPNPDLGTVRYANNDLVVVNDILSVAELTGLRFHTVLNANGAAGTFRYTVEDNQGGSAAQTITLTITPVNDAPSAAGDSQTVDEDSSLFPLAPGVLANDTDVDFDTLTAELGQNVTHGALTLFGDGSFIYQPDPNYFGPDSFTYRAKDPSGAYSGFATVTLTVNPVNDAPVAQDNSYSTRKATAVDVPAPGLLQNDSDVDGTPLSAVLRSGPAQGTLEFQPNGAFRYTPKVGFAGTDTFVYRASDGSLPSGDATVSIVVSAEPPVPDANVQASGSGTIAVAGGQASFSFDVRRVNGLVQGGVTYVDPVRTRSITSTQLTSLVGTGQTLRIFGKGKLSNGTVVDFVVDLADLAEPGRLKDTFRIELGSGPVTSGVLTTGNLRVNR